jgi:hypothetical protein
MKLAMRSVVAMLACLALTACQTTGSGGTSPPGEKAVPCAALSPILWSKSDTRDTQNQATEYNAVGARVCGWKGK